jgi:anti-sigma B factor antagonist
VTFVDSTSLAVLVSGTKLLREREGQLSVVAANQDIVRLFEITGLDRVLRIYPSRSDALANGAKG